MNPPPHEPEANDPFAGLEIGEWISRRAANLGLHLDSGAVLALVRHARRVLERNDRLHLTSVVDPQAFLERHLGESLEGAAMLAPGIDGPMLDLGSGNGYPGLPVAVARPLLEPVLSEASPRKARFLRELINDTIGRGQVLERQVQRAGDLDEQQPPIRVVVTRAAGNWERILPRLRPALRTDAVLLIWAGQTVDVVRRRNAWRGLELAEKQSIPGRQQSWIWRFSCRSMTS